MPVVTGMITTSSPLDTYPTHDSNLGLGGLWSCSKLSDRNAIATARRRWGMVAVVYNDGINNGYYKLTYGLVDTVLSNNSNWSPLLGSGSDSSFVYNQVSPTTIWNVNHNLNKMPSVTVVDSGGTEVEGLVHYVDLNNIQITFSAAFAGQVYCN